MYSNQPFGRLIVSRLVFQGGRYDSGDEDGLGTTREELTAAQAQDRERLAKLEGQFGESDKRVATKADVEAAIGAVRSDIRVLRLWLFIGVVRGASSVMARYWLLLKEGCYGGGW